MSLSLSFWFPYCFGAKQLSWCALERICEDDFESEVGMRVGT